MSKKKRFRRDIRKAVESAPEQLRSRRQEIHQFLNDSSPFEISYALTKRGVVTTHREGVYGLLDMHFQSQDPERGGSPSKRSSDQFLAHTWRREIEKKRILPNADDLIFLMSVAIHFAIQWSELRLKTSKAQLAEARAELARREQGTLNA